MNIIVNGLGYLLDLNEFTAKIVDSRGAKGNILIPRIINYESKDFLVTIIGYQSFRLNTKIKSIFFEENSELILIERYAFYYSSIESIRIPRYVKKIGEMAFKQCYELRSFEIPENSELISIEAESFSQTNILSVFIPRHCTSIDEKAFECTPLETITFADDSELISIKNGTFEYTNIQSISIPDKVKTIEENAFYYCRHLQTISFSINSELVSIGRKAFLRTAIDSLFIPSKVENINECFCDSDLKSILIAPNNNFFICIQNQMIIKKNNGIYENLIYVNCNVHKILIPSFIKTLGKYAFSGCLNLKEVYFPEKCRIESISESCFEKTAIEIINIPSCIKNIKKCAFYDCKHLKTVTFSDDSELISIEDGAFSNSAIEFITIPRGIKTLVVELFFECHRIKTVDFQEDSELQTIMGDVFSYTSIENFHIPSKVEIIKSGWVYESYKITNITISPDNKNFIIYNKIFLIGKTDIQKDSFDSLITVASNLSRILVIPSFIKKICSFAFTCCKYLRTIQFEKDSQLCSFGKESLRSFSLKNVTIPVQTNLIANIYRIHFPEYLNTIEYLGDSSDEILFIDYCPNIFLISFPNAKQVNYHSKYLCVSTDAHIFICACSRFNKKE